MGELFFILFLFESKVNIVEFCSNFCWFLVIVLLMLVECGILN